MDISGWISHWAKTTPQRVAVRFEDVSLSYAELESRVARTAGWLTKLRVAEGDRVAFLGPNCPELLELLFACARIGAMFVPLNARMPAPELRPIVDQTDPVVLLAELDFYATAVACAPHLVPGRIVSFRAGGRDLEAKTAGWSPRPSGQTSAAATPALIAYTSGTSGTPKGAVLTHEALAANADHAIAAFEMTAEDHILTAIPMFHVGGLNINTLPALRVGAGVTIHRLFDPERTLAEIESTRVTLFISVPQMSLAIFRHPDWESADIGSLRCVVTGSTMVGESAIAPWSKRGVPVVQVYGLTETCPIATTVPIQDAFRKASTAGRPVGSCRVRIADPQGRDVPAGSPGEVLIAGPNVMASYWRNPQATEDALHDGWFRSGDVGFFDDEGFLHIVDRVKDVIIVGSSNVYPADLERILSECPAIAESAVVGRPHDKLGEVPAACVVLAPGASLSADEVLALFHERLAPYKHPHDVLFLPALPRTALGKVQKHTLRELAANEARAGLLLDS